MHLSTRTLLALLGSAILAAPAGAATPESGKLTHDQRKVEWTGEAMGSALQYAHFFYGGQIVDDCVAPVCDTFTLEVADPGYVEISAEDESGYTEVQIKDAAGNEVFWSEGVEDGPTVFGTDVEGPTTFTVEVLTDAIAPAVIDDPSYTAFATVTPFDEIEPFEF